MLTSNPFDFNDGEHGGGSPIKRARYYREPDRWPIILAAVSILLIVFVAIIFFAITMESNNSRIRGNGQVDLYMACEDYLRLGSDGRMEFIANLERLGRSKSPTNATMEAQRLADYMSTHPEDLSFDRVRKLMTRCK